MSRIERCCQTKMVKIKFELVIFGDMFNPIESSKLINIEATNSWYKGDSIPNSKKNIVRQETVWEYSIDFIPTYFVEDVIQMLLEKFHQHVNIISQYIKKNDLNSKIDIVIEMTPTETPGLFFSKEFLHFMSSIDGAIDIDLIVLE